MGTRKTLENMQTAIDNAYDSIEEMGGDVPQARNLVNLSGTIDDLQNSVIAGVRGTNDAYQSTGKSYTKGESCIYNNVVYTAKDAISAPAGEFDPSKWDESSLASLRSSISDITTPTTITVEVNSTVVSGGDISYTQIGKLVVVDLAGVSVRNTGQDLILSTGLPKCLPNIYYGSHFFANRSSAYAGNVYMEEGTTKLCYHCFNTSPIYGSFVYIAQ